MINCQYCTKPMPGGSKVCPSCRKRVVISSGQNEVNFTLVSEEASERQLRLFIMECKHCSQEIPNEASFCPFCRGQVGVAANDGAESSTLGGQQDQADLQKKSNKVPPSNIKKILTKIWAVCVWAWGWIWNYFWVFLIFIALVPLFFVNNNSSRSTPSSNYRPSTSAASSYRPTSSSSSNYVRVGEYSCSQYHQSQLNILSPSETESSYIKVAQDALKERSDEIDSLEAEIKASDVTGDSPQYLLDEYNAKVNDFNAKLSAYKTDGQLLSAHIDRFNASVNAYNNYLMTNCRK